MERTKLESFTAAASKAPYPATEGKTAHDIRLFEAICKAVAAAVR